MIEQTGETYQSSKYAKAMWVAKGKDGKTCSIVGGLLGRLPWQTDGAVVTEPKHLHIISLDANAMGGVGAFLRETCKAPVEALQYRVYNMQEDFRAAYDKSMDYDATFYNLIMGVMNTIGDRVDKEKGVHAVVMSSLTGAVQALQRSLFGPPKVTQSKKSTADINKWAQLGGQVAQLQNYFQQDAWHMFWESHLFDTASQDGDAKESLALQGSVAKNFAFNVEQVFRMRRSPGTKHPGTKCDLTYLDTQPALEFAANGRGFNEKLAPREPCITVALKKLGLSVGGWKAK